MYKYAGEQDQSSRILAQANHPPTKNMERPKKFKRERQQTAAALHSLATCAPAFREGGGRRRQEKYRLYVKAGNVFNTPTYNN